MVSLYIGGMGGHNLNMYLCSIQRTKQQQKKQRNSRPGYKICSGFRYATRLALSAAFNPACFPATWLGVEQ